MKLNDINNQVYQLLEDLNTYGMLSSPRGQTVKEANVATLELDPTLCIMDFTFRKFNWKYLAGELAWYLRADNDIEFISKFSSFWKKVADKNGLVNSNYGDILLRSHPSTRESLELPKHESDSTLAYVGNIDLSSRLEVNQLKWVYDSLVKDKFSRQAVAFLNCPYYQYMNNTDFVCTMYINFWIRHDTLDMKVQMRSNDIFFGLSYDAPWFSFLHQSMFLNLKKIYPELRLGMYYHCADNIHFYERHFDLVEKIMLGSANVSPSMKMKLPLFEFNKNTGELELSAHSRTYVSHVESLVKSENFDKFTQEDWKNVISNLVDLETGVED